MEIEVKAGDITRTKADAIILGLFEGEKRPDGDLAAVDKALDGAISRLMAQGEIKGKLGWRNIPHVVDWIITQWHYGKDSLKEISGASLNVTFETWSKTLGRIYVKSELKRIRVEEIQSPRKPIQELFEEIINRRG